MKLIVFSDIHYAPEAPVNNDSVIDRKLMQYAVPLTEQLIDKINNSIKPDIAINLGDLIEDFNDHDKDIVNLNFIWDILKKIKCPFYSIIGNHDLRSMKSRKEIEHIMGYENATFSKNIKGYHLIFLGTTVNNEMGKESGGIKKTKLISDEELKWLIHDLDKNDLPCLIFTHYGIAEDNMKGNWWFEKSPNHALLENRKEVKTILKNSKNVVAVFSGHQHWTKKIMEEGIPYYIIGSLTENINDNGIPDGVYFEIDIDGNNIRVNECHLRL